MFRIYSLHQNPKPREVLPMVKPQNGVWYIVVTCQKCSRTIFLFPDLNNGKGAVDARYIVTCPRCQHKGGYSGRHYCHDEEK